MTNDTATTDSTARETHDFPNGESVVVGDERVLLAELIDSVNTIGLFKLENIVRTDDNEAIRCVIFTRSINDHTESLRIYLTLDGKYTASITYESLDGYLSPTDDRTVIDSPVDALDTPRFDTFGAACEAVAWLTATNSNAYTVKDNPQ